jgi:hypothetical protein
MKRTLFLLAVAIVTINSVGCCCCRGMRDWFYQGAYCGPSAAAMPAPIYASAPAPYASPYASPYAAPAANVPVFSHCTPQPTAPQYAVAAPTSVVYGDAGCGAPYMTEMGCGMPYMAEMGCGYDGYSDGMMMPSPDMYPGPAPE